MGAGAGNQGVHGLLVLKAISCATILRCPASPSSPSKWDVRFVWGETPGKRYEAARSCASEGKHLIPTRQTANSHHPQVQVRVMSQNHPRYRHHRHYRNRKCIVQWVHKHVKCGCHNLGLLLLSLLSEPRHPTTRSSGDDSKHTGHHRTSRPSCYCLATSCTWQQWVLGSP